MNRDRVPRLRNRDDILGGLIQLGAEVGAVAVLVAVCAAIAWLFLSI